MKNSDSDRKRWKAYFGFYEKSRLFYLYSAITRSIPVDFINISKFRPNLRVRGIIARFTILFCAVGLVSSGQAAEANWTQLFAFGDSFSDSGAGYVDGNGPTAIVYAAQDMGISFTYSTDPDAGVRGRNYAVSGAQTGEGEGEWKKDAFLGYGMQNQVRDFVEGVVSGAIIFAPEHTLFFLAGGLNDRQLETETTTNNLTLLIRQLHGVGARHFSIAVLPVRLRSFTDVATRLNPALKALPATLKAEFPDAEFRSSRWGEFFDTVMLEPARYGIINTTKACAGRAIFDQDTTPRGDPDTYYFYHSGHPSTAVHRIVGRELANEFRRISDRWPLDAGADVVPGDATN